jgi:hypothetical protein
VTMTATIRAPVGIRDAASRGPLTPVRDERRQSGERLPSETEACLGSRYGHDAEFSARLHHVEGHVENPGAAVREGTGRRVRRR